MLLRIVLFVKCFHSSEVTLVKGNHQMAYINLRTFLQPALHLWKPRLWFQRQQTVSLCLITSHINKINFTPHALILNDSLTPLESSATRPRQLHNTRGSGMESPLKQSQVVSLSDQYIHLKFIPIWKLAKRGAWCRQLFKALQCLRACPCLDPADKNG